MTPGLATWMVGLLLALGVLAAAGAAGMRRRSVRWATALLALAIAAFMVLVANVALVALVAQASHRQAYNDVRWILMSPWPVAARVLFLLLALAVIFLGWRSGRGLGWKRRATITVVRATGVTILFCILFEPALELRQVLRQHGHVAIVVDASRSMYADNGDQSRLAMAVGVVRQAAPLLTNIEYQHQVRWYALHRDLRPTTLAQLQTDVGASPSTEPSSAYMQTHLVDALTQLAQAATNGDLAGVLLLSDGVDTSGAHGGLNAPRDAALASALTRFRQAGVAVHTVAFGTQVRDLEMGPVTTEPFAFVRTVTTASATVACRGVTPQTVTATLRINGEASRRKDVRLCDAPAGASGQPISFEYTPQQTGALVVELEIDVLAGEASGDNNRAAAVISVVRDKVRILHLAGEPSWDVRAMRQQLRHNPNVEVVAFYVLRHSDDIAPANDAELSLIAFPSAELFTDVLPSFDLVILQNFDYRTDDLVEYLDELERYVTQGGGLIMLGGRLAFGGSGPGAYAGTPLAELLPFALLAQTTRDERAFAPQLAAAGEIHPATTIVADRARNRLIWQGMPQMSNAHVIGDLVADAQALVTHPTRKTPRGHAMPVIAARAHGKGRVIATTTDSLWRLWFEGSEAEASTGRDYQLLIEAMLQWTMRDDNSRLVSLAGPARVPQGRPAGSLTVALRTPAGLPQARTPVRLAIAPLGDATSATSAIAPLAFDLTTDDQGTAVLALADAAGLRDMGAGTYQATASASVAGLAHAASLRFYIEPAVNELSTPAANLGLLAHVSQETGGTALVEPSALPATLPFAKPRQARVAAATDVRIWNHPLVFLALVGLWLGEWLLRRRGGYL